MNNLFTHLNKGAGLAMRGHGCGLPCLPPCSPDFDPIEMAFTKLKKLIRKAAART